MVAAALAAGVLVGGCKRPSYDTSTPQAAVDAMAAMVRDGRPELLPTMVFIEARDVAFSDGVTEASAIEDVKGKTGEMLGRLWRISGKVRRAFPADVDRELAKGGSWVSRNGFGEVFTAVMADPFGWLDANRSRLVAEDMGDGTAAFEIDGKPVLGGSLLMQETGDGWRLAVPVELLRASGYYPDTREEWAVLASMMLSIENALIDFESELDSGRFRNLAGASERAGRLISESAVAQAVIYGMMIQNDPARKAEPPEVDAKDVQRALGNTGDAMRRRAE